MDELLEILREIKPDIDFEHEDNLIESGLMDSLDIVAIIDAVQEHFKIELDGKDIEPDNFVSAAAIWKMVERYNSSGRKEH